MKLAFHWRLMEAQEADGNYLIEGRFATGAAIPRLAPMTAFCKQAEASGIESLLINIHYWKPDPLTLSLPLARATSRLRFLVAHRPGLVSPTMFAQQVNTFAALTNGRIILNLVAGHSPEEQRYFGDHLAHDDRYLRMDEYLETCFAYWWQRGPVHFRGKHYTVEDGRLGISYPRGQRPLIFLGGNSEAARRVAGRWADVWVRFPDTPEKLAREVRPMLDRGVAIGLRMAVITRATRKKALAYGKKLIAEETVRRHKMDRERAFVKSSDSQSFKRVFERAEEEWMTPYIWLGPVRIWGAPNMTLIGSPEEVAQGIMTLKAAGISHFILSGWPKLEEMTRFGRDVIPLVRKAEAAGPPGDAVAGLRADSGWMRR